MRCFNDLSVLRALKLRLTAPATHNRLCSADGKVSGSSADNGCSLLGLWAPGLTPRLFNLDITLKRCRFAGLNRRHAGTVMATFADNSARFSLFTYAPPIPGQPTRRYDVGATLRR
jgi:hypothetical protein